MREVVSRSTCCDASTSWMPMEKPQFDSQRTSMRVMRFMNRAAASREKSLYRM